ncbi:uncharacterized protein DSM5745_07958 [Aspergillus mulundensis]|uniref:Uncharacterized protein n=1 Tax=Aspergillus mulundensis TaxID=1810919 RepID=A0A3D8RFP5_9EURO|nr:Uncharacterized protein DSM5745_07958 [Aspergillus mulundensis]RDW72786.1 Uncharacterized protein DSM5745_07958 [Aspergillus mulundensis]
MSVHGFNASVSAGWYTFSNLGPLTTTYTPEARCTASSQMFLGYLNDMPTYGGNIYPAWNVQCTTEVNYYDGCVPTSTEPVTTKPPAFTGSTIEEYEEYQDAQIDWRGWEVYYSPGLYCPAGWTTIGMIGRDKGDTTTSSGILSPLVSTTQTENPKTSGYYDYEDPASVVKSVLKPQQTMALCCPSGMKADTAGNCYSFVKDYTPTSGCMRYTDYDYEYGSSTATWTNPIEGSTITTVVPTPTETISTVEVDTTRLDPDQDYYTGMFFVPVVTLLYHEDDLAGATGTAEANESMGSSEEGESDSASETPSNAAGRLGVGASLAGWEGFGSVVGVWLAAAGVGAAMVLPW